MTFLSIQQLSEDDRPREKLIRHGRAALSDSELIAILLGSGYREKNAILLAQEILSKLSNDLDKLAKLSVQDLKQFKGIGEAKAVNIITALELGRRRKYATGNHPKVNTSEEVYEYLKQHLYDKEHEEFWLLCLSRSNKIINASLLSKGGRASTIVDPKVLFKHALDHKASAIILAHNHPSSNVEPSNADKQITHKVYEAGKLLEIPVLDHIIFSENGYFSFADEGLLS